ncbi:hypothetical protein COU00_03565 [Candidatus Falkowbacteria bacterium CG10_big_fil_rev_8_21_14_0_10_43_11]|uniref:Uncharacterized protein n=1 Tax=Candidatus Falkowbacteria bacterium CG10_big_fil_rev_8_21_14_0_10_43_11 TaxID=1974568 RepID=A0A2M6WL98_9BACT|nr:MAG: hypothetical protein COU00_03565 [Candidatus Falkowbacteria bacterium CG10_big_fil_rev_8_21_14_0_10_43_11]
MSELKKQNKKAKAVQRVMPENIFRDIDPRDPIVVLDDIISHLQEMQDALIEERELKFKRQNGRQHKSKIVAASSHPLVAGARRYAELTQVFLDEFWFEQQKHLIQYGLDIPIDDIASEIERLTWFYPVILSKSWRYVTEQKSPPQIPRRANIINLPSSREVLIDCVGKSEKALLSFSKKRTEQRERTAEMLKLLEQIKERV